MTKKILYLDMDGVVADFNREILHLCPNLNTSAEYPDFAARSAKVDEICIIYPHIFLVLQPIPGAIKAVEELFDLYDVYFLSTPIWSLPESFTDKRKWLEAQFGDKVIKRLILTHRKDLAIGDYLVDDRLKHGAAEFRGIHIHFGTERFPDWDATLAYLKQVNQNTIS